MKLTLGFFFLAVCFIAACTDKVSTSDMIVNVVATPSEALADGSTIISLSATLNNDMDQRKVLFKTDRGSFADNKNADSIIVTAEKIDQQLTAFARLQVPSTAGLIKVTVQMAIDDQKGRFVYTKQINTTASTAKQIELTSESFSVFNNFDGEIKIMGTLTNENKKGVSKGYKVQIEDVNASFVKVNGRFRSSNLTSNESSQISTIYSPGFVTPNQSIYLIATILDDAGKKTTMSDTITIAIIQKH